MDIVNEVGPKNIAYDFDGVLHYNVTKPDNQGQRNPLNIAAFDPFNNILEKIKSDISRGYQIHIVTARINSPHSQQAIENFLKQSILAPYRAQIKRHFSAGANKANILAQLKANVFYDDSCMRIKEVYQAAEQGLLPHLSSINFVYPELNLWIPVTSANIDAICNQDIAYYIDQYVAKYNYHCDNLQINALLSYLYTVISNATMEESKSQDYMKYINRLRRDISMMMMNEKMT